jgi:dGTPase
MDWNKLLSQKRLAREGEAVSNRPGRTEFESDVGRISFSGAFRRLARKTQVHPLAPNDHVHTRLTHTIEVAYVGRALGKELGNRILQRLPQGYSADDLGTVVHAACLAHDLGNPPFGHGGEEGMIYWFETNGPQIFRNLSPDHKHDLIAVEGNAQGFRTVGHIHPRAVKILIRGSLYAAAHEHPVVAPHVSHFMQVPFRTKVKFPHSPHISPS